MRVHRRSFVLAIGSMAVVGRKSYGQGSEPAVVDDAQIAQQILDGAPRTTPFATMTYLMTHTKIKNKSDPDHPETFNQRWNHYANPLIREIFKEIGYAQKLSAGDCTAWCAATVSWCLKRCGYSLPHNAIAAVSFKNYGNRVEIPEEGDLAVFQDLSNPAHGHVGFYVNTVDDAKDTIVVRGGNESQTNAKITSTECGKNIQNNLISDNNMVTNLTSANPMGHLKLIGYQRYT